MVSDSQLRSIYASCYAEPSYRMGLPRLGDMMAAIENEYERRAPQKLSLLDVGCGRGELLRAVEATIPAHRRGELRGREIVPALCTDEQAIPRVDLIDSVAKMDTSERFDIVCCADVLEHIDPRDTMEALDRLWASTKQAMILNVAWFSHIWPGPNKEPIELHINRMGAEQWRTLLRTLPGLVVGTMVVYANQTARFACWRHP